MKNDLALQNLLNGTATDEEIQFLQQGIAKNEISISGTVNHSIIVIGNGNSIQLSPDALNRLSARPLLGDVDYDLEILNTQYTTDEVNLYINKFINEQKETPSSDPYAEYLIAQFKRIDQFLKTTFQIASGGFQNTILPLQLRYKPHTGVVNEDFEVIPLKHDPLTNVIGKRYETPRSEYSDLREAYLEYKGRLLLLGEGGAGKTISLLMFARDCIIRRLQNPSKPLPILGIVPTWDYRKRPSMAAWLQESYGAPDHVEELLKQGEALLILDGLDELVPDISTSIDPQALFLETLPLNNHVVLTCRFHTSTFLKNELRLNGAISVLPVSEAQILDYVSQFPTLKRIIKPGSDLAALLDTPIMLALFTEAYHDVGAKTLAGFEQLPDILHRKYEVIGRVFDHRWRRTRVSDENGYTLEMFRKALEILAYEMLMMGPIGNPYQLSMSAIEEILDGQGGEIVLQAERMGVLVRTGETTWRFSHSFYRSYFAFQFCLNAISDTSRLKRGVQEIVYLTADLDFEDREVVDEFHRRKVIDRCVDVIRASNPDEEVLGNISDVLGLLSRFGEVAADAFKELLSIPNSFIRFNALYALTLDLQPFAIQIIEDALAEMDAEGRHDAVAFLSKKENPLLIPVFLDILRGSDADLWYPTIQALLPYEELALEELAKKTGENPLMSESLKIYQREGSAPAVNYLLDAIRKGAWKNDPFVRLALCLFADEQTLFRMKELLTAPAKNEQEYFYYWAMSQIARRFPESAYQLLQDEDPFYRQIAVIFISHGNDANPAAQLFSALEDPDRYVRLEAARGLIRLGPGMLVELEARVFGKPAEYKSYEEFMETSNALMGRCLSELSDIADRKSDIRQDLLITLMALVGKIQPANVPMVIDALTSRNENYRLLIRGSLMLMGEHAYDALAMILKSHKDSGVRSEVRLIFQDLGIDPDAH